MSCEINYIFFFVIPQAEIWLFYYLSKLLSCLSFHYNLLYLILVSCIYKNGNKEPRKVYFKNMQLKSPLGLKIF